MGLLAESKRSSKISRDPNNTKWTKNENSFGQKIMRSQGWAPGQYLGAQNAPQAESYTAANASYIRVSLKDDMKGLGFNKAKEDQVTGLDVFSDLLGRLNGKSEAEVEDGRQARMAIKANYYVEQKWGPMRFVRGGLLVGDKVKELNDEESSKESSSSEDNTEEEKPKKSKKRKASVDEDEEQEESESAKKKRRKEERRAKKALKQAAEEVDEPEDTETKAKKKSKKSKKSRSEDVSEEPTPAPEEETKAERKERKREKKEKKRKRREAQESDDDATASASASASASALQSAAGSGTSTPVRGSRNFVRSRFIAQKKEALLDAKALNQIFMVKA